VKKALSIILILSISFISIAAQINSITAKSRYSFYSNETLGEIMLVFPDSQRRINYKADVYFGEKVLVFGFCPDPSNYSFIKFPIGELPYGESNLTLKIRDNLIDLSTIEVGILKLAPKFNEVKIDYASGGLIVNNLPFFPFGFYCYSPVQLTLPEEELAKGFNMISPYQKIKKETIEERKLYMDRCAELGMKVHYNLLSVAGGGGVGSDIKDNKTRMERLRLLIDEVEFFRDHPALLAWYISDEPTGHKISPKELEEIYELIKELDPYHPVSIVFMASNRAREYSNAMDIIMADPYPLPNGSVLEVNKVANNLHGEFNMEKPVWIVPQAFGGSEWWLREPTSGELRVMTYLSVINKATGIQYFVRHGYNSFPKSTVTWSECGAISREIAELTPFLFSMEKPPKLICKTPGVLTNSWMKNGQLVVIAVNTRNNPTDFAININEGDFSKYNNEANLLFENRTVAVKKGKISDIIDAHGTRVYLIGNNEINSSGIIKSNLVHDPGFEDNISVGTPSYCYAKNMGDRGASYFIDSRIAYQGNHSLRMVTPKENEGMRLSFYPLSLKKGKTYKISIWAKAQEIPEKKVSERGFFGKLLNREPEIIDQSVVFKLALASISSRKFELDTEWKEYSFNVRLSSNGEDIVRGGPVLSLLSKSTAWFDLLQVIEID